jgi:hypothetical protein
MFLWSEAHGFNPGGTEANSGAYVTHAVFYKENEDGSDLILPQIGVICFYLGEMDAGVVSHEMTHAAIYWFEAEIGSCSLLNKPKHLEELCWVQGWLVTQFWARYWRLVDQGRLPQ